jgi:hypothetical protein
VAIARSSAAKPQTPVGIHLPGCPWGVHSENRKKTGLDFRPESSPRPLFQYRQGHADEARTALAEATTLIDAEVQKWKPDDGNMGNHDWFMSIIVRKEAEALIAGKPAK